MPRTSSSNGRRALAASITILLLLGLPAFGERPVQTPATKQGEKPVTLKENIAAKGEYRSPGDRHKLSVTDPNLVTTLKAQGARVLADYGTFTLLEANGAVTNTVAGNEKARVVDENNRVLLNAGAIDTTVAATGVKAALATPGKRMRLIQFVGPVRPEWFQALAATGVRIVTYIPNNAYLVYGDAKSVAALQKITDNKSVSQWDGEYLPSHRLDPAITATADVQSKAAQAAGESKPLPGNLSARGNEQFTIQMIEDADENKVTLALIEQYRLEPVVKQDKALGYLNVRVALPKDVVVNQIANRVDVVSVQPWVTPKKRDEHQDIILSGNISGTPAVPTVMDYLSYLTGKGFALTTPSSFAINLSDSGIDNGTTTPNHFALYRSGDPTAAVNSRIIYNRLEGSPNGGSTLQGCDGHGNENSHIIGGYVPTGTVGGVNFAGFPHADASSLRWDVGVAPFVRIGSSVIFDPDTFTSPVYQNLESQAYRDGARISSNSWGGTSNNYSVDAQQYDALVRDAQPDSGCSGPNCISASGNQDYVIVFAAGNAGSTPNTVGEPGTAKNVITVGAAENVNPFGGSDGCSTSDTDADDANDIISFSSRGPTSDGRIKPDIMAPGTHVSAGAPQTSIVSPAGSGSGAQLPCFDGSGVCGGVGSNFFPAGQQWYTASSGTSHATPAISGVAALIRQYFINQSLTPPSAAMTKALMLNSARYMTGQGANDTLPSNNQGMGEADLDRFFDVFATGHSLHDQVGSETFTASGQQRTISGTVSDASRPLRITLAWTDAPGPTTGSAYVNNLDLEVTVGGNTYLGNVFTGATSVTGGTADTRNNVESVFLPAGVTGPYTIRVKATNIAGDGVPNNAQPLDQDFALVVYNGSETPVPVISAGLSSITAEGCSPGDNQVDPGETVTVTLALSNTGTANTSNLVATLLPTGGVTSPSGPQTYGAVVAGGSAVSKSFTFTAANVSCGSTVVATLQLQDGATNLGTISYNFTTGVLNVTLGEDFDGVVAPALPAGWSASNATGSGLWTTSAATPDTAPNDAFVNDPATVSDKRLDTPAVSITSSTAQISFRQNFAFESGFDGGVLEISAPNINGGAFTDILNPAVGGSFVSNGYNATISTSAGSVIGGRQAWSGSSGGYITTVANLGPNVVGQSVKLRFRAASDGSVAGTGWRVDTVKISNGYLCCGVTMSALPPAVVTAENFSPANSAPDPGEYVTVNLSLVNNGGTNTTNLIATLQATGGVANPSGPQNYGVVVGGGPAVSRSFSFIANGNCGDSLTLTLAVQDGTSNLGTVSYTLPLGASASATQTFSNATAIVIPASGTGATTGAPANPYPSGIVVSGMSGAVSKVTVTLKQISHTFPSDVDVLLVSPTGQKFIVMSDVIGGTDWTGQTYTLDDSAAAILPSSGTPPVTGTYRPTNYNVSNVIDAFPTPAPVAPWLSPATAGADTFASAFNGQNPNGTWSLYVVDDSSGDSGTFAGGWDLTITTSGTVCQSNKAPSIVNGPPPSPVTVGSPYSFTFIASGNPSPTFSVTGALPPGLNLSPAGVLSGTPTSGGSGSFPNITVKASNAIAPDAMQTFALNAATTAQNYLAGFNLSGGDAVLTFDYDGDGIANLMEYGLGLNPTVAGLTGLPVVTLKDYSGTRYLSMTFNRSSLATDLTYIVQGSGDLTNWTDLGTSTGGGATTGAGFIQETGSAPTLNVEVRDTTPYSTTPGLKRYLRLKITSP